MDSIRYVCMPFKNKTYVRASYYIDNVPPIHDAQTGRNFEVRLRLRRRSWQCALGSLDCICCVISLDAAYIYAARPHGTVSTARAETICSCGAHISFLYDHAVVCYGLSVRSVCTRTAGNACIFAGSRFKRGTHTEPTHERMYTQRSQHANNVGLSTFSHALCTLYSSTAPAYACVRLSELHATSK